MRLSGTAHAKQVHPEDNQPAPTVNFDVRLNQKMSAPLRSGARRARCKTTSATTSARAAKDSSSLVRPHNKAAPALNFEIRLNQKDGYRTG